jgi:hypothetical protein
VLRLVASVLLVFGCVLIGSYLWAAVIVPWGEPDQSLLYWYLFLPLLGLLSLRAGIRLRRRLRNGSAR